MLEAETVKTQAKNVRPKSEDVSVRARRVVRRNECGRRETILCVAYWSIHGNTKVRLVKGTIYIARYFTYLFHNLHNLPFLS